MNDGDTVILLTEEELEHLGRPFILKSFAVGDLVVWQAIHRESRITEVSVLKNAALAGCTLSHIHWGKS